MNTRNHLPGLVVGIVLLAGCQSLEIPPPDARSDPLPESSAVERSAEPMVDRVAERVPERTVHLAMTIPRPHPPAAEPLELEPALPEPEVAAPSAALPDIPNRNLEFNLAPHGFSQKSTVLAFGPSPRALAAAERPPAAREEAAAEVQKPAEGTERAATAGEPAATPSKPAAKIVPTPQSLASRPEPVGKPMEIEAVRRELVARKGDPIAVDLEGNGWIYTGLKSAGVYNTEEDQGIDFLSRQSSLNRTSFNFKAVDYGEYELSFQYQDHKQALLRSQVVHLQVVPEQEFADAVQRQAVLHQQPELYAPHEGASAGIEPKPGPPIRSADALFELGEYDLALIEYKRNMRSGDSYLNDRLAECYERTGEYLAAVKYYRENLDLKGEYGERAALGLVRSSIATEDSHLLLEVVPSLFSIESVQIGAELLAVARFQTEDRRFPVAIQALEQYIRRYPEGRELDEVYFRLAEIYEVDSPYRDLESARHYYSLLYESFPESLYVEPAAERLDYLDRYFFLVQ